MEKKNTNQMALVIINNNQDERPMRPKGKSVFHMLSIVLSRWFKY
ncbi:hypothetical protein [Desulfitobacterium hafniense]|uniref:Uncharacterized protein n=2 Tax=Desulfitobacterium hafniense TaxID=49338 RepID=A0A098B220_DESHA|nr:hypothetical protein [Desulfitobacterium hafniense]EHL04722.1 hypothetical protein HMPREF0322_04608 [Desulfitobacterium hafniense DP7]CDX02914.1 Hypothetical protein DPCES_3027 [Desulfitobacterium hafniense]